MVVCSQDVVCPRAVLTVIDGLSCYPEDCLYIICREDV